MSEYDPRLTWRSRHDPRSKSYGVADLLAQGVGIPERRTWRHGRILDQGREGSCTGMAVAGDLAASPHRVKGVDETLAVALYKRAQQIDQWPGENYEGSSVIAAVQAAAERGYLGEYRWAFSIDDLADAVRTLGPAIIGIPWWSGFYNPPTSGLLRKTGRVVGGHAILVTGYHPRRRLWGEGWTTRHAVFTLVNSWGSDWGRRGVGYITRDDLAALLDERGEACIPLVRHLKERPQ